ncbi:AAA family ATPase [Mycolicibacterium sphagni]|uniref:AAA family ATPase n=1 Tax=Mycolicibacterium sphagni TaxID=1786 RepID=A0ABX2JZW3_9MYCO|nr:AAA family ATPase [Mycolicibacterium sphagni]
MTDTELAERAFRIGVGNLGIPTSGTSELRSINLPEARRAFQKAVEIDDGMCDAWLGLAMVTMQEQQGTAAVIDRHLINQCYRTRNRLGTDQRRLGLAPNTLSGLYPAGMLNLRMCSRDDVGLARAALLAEDLQYDDTVALINQIKDQIVKTHTSHQLADYLLGTIYMRTERWPDVLAVLNTHDWTEGVLLDCVNYMAGTACAHLGMFTEAARRLDAVTTTMGDVYNKALLERAYVYRELGDENQARALFEALHAHMGDPELGAAASRALTDPTVRMTVTTEDLITARTNIWDPATTPTVDRAITEDRRTALLKEAADEMANLIGLESVKDNIEDIAANAVVAGKLREKGLPVGELTENILLSGPAGTGKTQVARILAKIFAGHGVIETDKFVEATEEDLVSKYVAETREKTSKVIDSALGGVLFIDEIYTLVKESREHNHGKEAIEGLLHRLENDREQLVVIVAGYEEDIDKFLRTNSGLLGRFTQRIRFRSYDADQLVAIADVLAPKAGAPLTADARDTLRAACTEIYNDIDPNTGLRRIDTLGNGRFIRQVIKHASTARNRRLIRAGTDLDEIEEHTDLTGEDITRGIQKAAEAESEAAQSR